MRIADCCAIGTLLMALSNAPTISSQELVPADGEFQVNSYTTGWQDEPSVASDADGNFIITWSGQIGTHGIYASRFARDGLPLSTEFAVSTYAAVQSNSSVAINDAGDFVAVWSNFEQDGDGGGIFGQRFDNVGTPQGSEFQVNSSTTAHQGYPRVAMAPNGDFVVVWETFYGQSPPHKVSAKRFLADGTDLGEFDVPGPYSQRFPDVAADASGDFVVAWQEISSSYDTSIYAQRFFANGTPVSGNFQVDTYGLYSVYPSVDVSDNGTFVVVWEDFGFGADAPDLFGRRFTSAGAFDGPEFQVNSYFTGWQSNPRVTMDHDGGGSLVTWHSGLLSEPNEVFAQRFGADGSRLGSEQRITEDIPGDQYFPTVAADSDGDVIVVWDDEAGNDGSSHGVFATRFRARNELFVDFAAAGLWVVEDASWQSLTPWNPLLMKAWGDELMVAFGSGRGLYSYDGTAFTHLAGWDPYDLQSAGLRFAAAFDSGRGIWSYDGGWTQLTPWEPIQMVGVSGRLAADFGPGRGIYLHDLASGWQQLTNWIPYDLESWNGQLVAAFDSGRGIWAYDLSGAGWTQLTNWEPAMMQAHGDELVVSFASSGIYAFGASGWQQRTNWVPYELASWNDSVIAAFDSGRGLWQLGPGGWLQLTNWEPTQLAAADDSLMAQFGAGRGLYSYGSATGWVQLTNWVSEGMESAGTR